MSQEKVAYPQAERQRVLQSITFAPSQVLSRDLPRDTVLKSLQIRLSGAIQTTFASGTPVADSFSIADNLISRIDVVVNGSRTVKSVRPIMLRIQQLFTTTILGERRSSSGAAAVTNPTVDQGFVYGTTTQYSTVAETLLLSFEHVYSEIGAGREDTWLNLKGVASAEIRFSTNAHLSLIGFGNTAPVTYGNSTLAIDMVTREAQDIPPQIIFSDWKQTTKEVTFSAQTTDFAIDINRGNKLSGLMLLTKDGAAGSATTATGKVPSNLVVTKVNLKVNGQTDIKNTTFLQLQNENRAMFGVSAPMASNVSLLDGFAYLQLLARKNIKTALDVRPPMVDNVQLYVSTGAAADVSYTNPASLSIMTEEIVEPR